MKTKINPHYLPASLSKKDKKTQLSMLNKSRKLYKQHRYYTRINVGSFQSKPSSHVQRAMKLYNVKNVALNRSFARKTGCKLSALKQIVKKGEGAYYSSGSRPNQTPQSWAYARLASAVTGGNASLVDYSILEQGCAKNSRALKMAKRTRKKRKKNIN